MLTIRYARVPSPGRRQTLRKLPLSGFETLDTTFSCLRPSALLASGFYCIPAPEQQRITACRRSAPSLHSVSLRCSVSRTLSKRLTCSPFCFARMRVAFGILEARAPRRASDTSGLRPDVAYTNTLSAIAAPGKWSGFFRHLETLLCLPAVLLERDSSSLLKLF